MQWRIQLVRAQARKSWRGCALVFLLFAWTSCRASPLELVLFFPPRALDASRSVTPDLGKDALPIFVAEVIDRRQRPLVIGEIRGLGDLVTGRIHAVNACSIWVRGAANYELTRAGLHVLDDEERQARDASEPLLELDLTLLSTQTASDREHPGEVVLSTTLRRNGGILVSRRVRGTSPYLDRAKVRIDPAESLAKALRAALSDVVQAAALAAQVDTSSSAQSSIAGKSSGESIP